MAQSTSQDKANAIQRARDAAARRGWRVSKGHDRKQHLSNHGLLQLIDERNIVLLGANYDATPDEVVAYCRNR